MPPRFSIAALFFPFMFIVLSALYSPCTIAQLQRVEVKSFNGIPTLFVNGEPNAGMTYMTYRPKERYFRDFGDAGVDFVSFSITANDTPRGRRPVWVARNRFDFTEMDSIMNFVVRANPEALIFPRVYLFAPQWWMEENPDELMVYHDGETRKPIRGGTITTLPSWASEKWREDTAYCLRKMIEHIKSQPYGDRVVGYHLASGGTDEWYYYPNYRWFFGERMEDFLDYGKAQTSAFRRWLREKYTSAEALQMAWHNDSVTFETAEIASKRDKTTTDFFVFFNPAKSQHVIDSFDFEAEIVAETIAYLCGAVKEATDGKAFTGAFYGYVTGAVDKVYNATHKLLQSPYIDFLTSPSAYSFREPGSGYSTYRTLTRSVSLHGKLWWDENDYYTYLTPEWKWVEGWTGPRDFKTTEAQQLRQLTNQIVHGSAGWWFDMEGGWFDAPEAIELIRKLNAIGEKSVFADRRSAAEIAVVVDEKSINYIQMEGDLYRPLIMEQRMPVGRIGAPADWLLMDDLETAPQYTMYVFLNAFHLTDAHMRALEKIKRNGARAIVWVFAPGFAGKTLDVQNSYEATGIKLKCIRDKSPLHVEITSSGGELLPGVPAGERYGTDNKIGPVIVGDDPDADVLGTLFGFGEPGLIRKTVDGIDTYFSTAPKLSASVLRAIAERAGAHIYNFSDDVTYVNRSFIGIHTPRSGERILRFPEPTTLYDVYHEKMIAADVVNVTIDLPARETMLYFMGNKEEWDALGR